MSDNMLYDVAITGGGLAGLSLAIQCARAGHAVILFEKELYPFHKVCGEYISLESWPFLERLGIPLSAMNLPVIKKLQLSDASGRLYQFPLDLGGFGISRYALDEALYAKAISLGAKVVTQAKVTDIKFDNDQCIINTHAATYAAKIAVCSYGKKSNLDVKWNRKFTVKTKGSLQNFVGVKYHIRHQHPSDVIALHNFKNGYCGISKIEDDKSCLCYLTTAANLQQCGNSIAAMESRILYQNPNLRQIFTECEWLYTQPLSISQISFMQKTQVEDHILFAGDASGMITPLCGNGMSMALHGSKLLFECVHAFLKHKIDREQMEQQYVRHWNALFKNRLWVGRQVQRFFGGQMSTAIFLATMNALPFASSGIIKATHGKAF